MIVTTLSTDGLKAGAHLLNVRGRRADGLWTSVTSRSFLVIATEPLEPFVEYFFDSDPGQGKATPIALPTTGGDVITFEVDLTGLSTGDHTLNVRAKGSDGLWRPLASEAFTLTANSGISATEVEQTPTATFTLDGYRTNTTQRGVNIIRFKDGKTKKVIVNNRTKKY